MARFRSTYRALLALGLAAGTPPAVAGAQDSARVMPTGWRVASTVAMPGIRSQVMTPLALTLGFSFTQDRFSRPVVDAALGIMPLTLMFGVVPVTARLGVALPMETISGFAIVPQVGGTTLLVAAPGDGGMLTGWYSGLALTTRDQKGGGVRLGVTWHRFIRESATPVWLAELGFFLK